MSGIITWEQIAFLFGLLGTICGGAGFLWARVESARKTTREELRHERLTTQAQIDSVRNELIAFRIHVAESYANYTALSRVDERVQVGLREVKDQIETLRADVMNFVRTN